MTIKQTLGAMLQHEELNFLLTNRIPRQLVTQFMGWFSRIENALISVPSLWAFRFFADDLDLQEAKEQRFKSLHDCFIRELKAGARPVDSDPGTVVSPCDAIVGASGRIAGTELIQAKGFPYTLKDLLHDPDLVRLYTNGRYVTLRLKANRSDGPGEGTAATGRPEAIASRITFPKVSVRDGKTKQSALA